jgi:hypothetical protein
MRQELCRVQQDYIHKVFIITLQPSYLIYMIAAATQAPPLLQIRKNTNLNTRIRAFYRHESSG